MDSASEQEQIAHLRKSNERLTILCLILSAIAIGAGLYARIQQSTADNNQRIAVTEAKRAAEQKEKARLSAQEAVQQRKVAEALASELARLKAKSKK